MSVQEEHLKAIADAIRAKEGSTGAIPAEEFPARIAAIQTGTDTADGTAGAGDILSGKIAYSKGQRLVGTMPSVVQATPGITVSSAGLITASASQEAGHVAAGTKSATRQLTTQAGTTITPGTARKTAVSSGRYTTGTVYVSGDTNLVAGNIKKGVSIFGVAGSYDPSLPTTVVTLDNSNSYPATFWYTDMSGTFQEKVLKTNEMAQVTMPQNSIVCFYHKGDYGTMNTDDIKYVWDELNTDLRLSICKIFGSSAAIRINSR